MKKKVYFNLPPRGTLQPKNDDDPLDYYYRPLVGFLYRSRIEQALSLLSPPYESILEIGYGSGVLLPTLTQMAKTVYAVDMKSDPVKTASSLARLGVQVKLSKADILTIDYPENSFDLIVAVSVFEHIKDLKPVLDKLAKLLRRDGKLLIGMPRVDNFMSIAFPLIGFKNIQVNHITNHEQFIKASKGVFRLVKFSAMPSWMPAFAGLYFNMLFHKCETN